MLDKVVDIEPLSRSLQPYLTDENKTRISRHITSLKGILLKYPSMRQASSELLHTGVAALLEDDYWISLEISAALLSQKDDVMFRRCLHHIVKAVDIQRARPSIVHVFDTGIELLDWYRKSLPLAMEINAALLAWDKTSAVARSTCRANAQLAVKCLRILCDEHEVVRQGIMGNGLGWFGSTNHFNKIFVEYPITDKNRLLQSALFGVLSTYQPSKFSTVWVPINHKNIDITDLAELSPAIVGQLKFLACKPKFKGDKEHDLNCITARFIANVTSMRSVFGKFPQYLNEAGLNVFKMEKYLLLTKAKPILSMYRFNELILFLEDYFDHKIYRHDYTPHLLSFYFEKQGKFRIIDYSRIHQASPILFEEIKAIHESEVSLIAEKNYSMETLHTRFSKLQRLLLNYLFPHYLKDVKQQGINCLSLNSNRIQKALFQQLQSAVKHKAISLRTGTSYMEVIRWLMSITGQDVVEAYKISFKRYQRHARRARMEDLYSDDELTELVFYIEKGIRETENRQQLLALYFARIQIKSCWNISPMADIELSDITDVTLPTSKKGITLLIQKPRKGYDIDVYSLDGKAVNSVMRDIVYVRDKLTAKYRELTDSQDVKNYLFIFEEKTNIYRLDPNNIPYHIKTILHRLGCKVDYNSMRIRKNGANHLYRDVAKQMRAYEAVKLHSFDTFINHYQRISESETQQTLHTAVDVMQRYFNGREIDPTIKILMQDDGSTQKTPTGECVSESNDSEAIQYHREHRNLIASSSEKGLWCSDYLACIWCKHFRTVADPEHVWQLLSYRDYVLADMAASTSDIDNNEFQKASIKALHNRVDAILDQLEIKNKQAVIKGKELIKKNGIHPFWAFAVTSVK